MWFISDEMMHGREADVHDSFEWICKLFCNVRWQLCIYVEDVRDTQMVFVVGMMFELILFVFNFILISFVNIFYLIISYNFHSGLNSN